MNKHVHPTHHAENRRCGVLRCSNFNVNDFNLLYNHKVLYQKLRRLFCEFICYNKWQATRFVTARALLGQFCTSYGMGLCVCECTSHLGGSRHLAFWWRFDFMYACHDMHHVVYVRILGYICLIPLGNGCAMSCVYAHRGWILKGT